MPACAECGMQHKEGVVHVGGLGSNVCTWAEAWLEETSVEAIGYLRKHVLSNLGELWYALVLWIRLVSPVVITAYKNIHSERRWK